MHVETEASKEPIVRRRKASGLEKFFFAAFFALLMIVPGERILGQKIAQQNFMGDETIWITAGLHYTDLVLRGDFDHRHWDAPELASAGSLNQPLGKYMLGAGIRLHPDLEAADLDFRGVYTYSKSVGWNAARGKVPTKGLLRRAREVNSLIALACFLLLFAAVTLYSNPFAGVIAVALVIFNDWVMICFTWALTDTSYNLFLLLGFSAGLLFFRAEGMYRVCLGAGLCGLVGGLACSVKITGLAVLGLFFLGLVAYRVLSKRGRVREGVLWLAVFGTSALAVVYAIQPLLLAHGRCGPFAGISEAVLASERYVRSHTFQRLVVAVRKGAVGGDPQDAVLGIQRVFGGADIVLGRRGLVRLETLVRPRRPQARDRRHTANLFPCKLFVSHRIYGNELGEALSLDGFRDKGPHGRGCRNLCVGPGDWIAEGVISAPGRRRNGLIPVPRHGWIKPSLSCSGGRECRWWRFACRG